jgi:ATP-binding cassette subfamily B protein
MRAWGSPAEKPENPIKLVVRAMGMVRKLRWPALAAVLTAILATIARLLGPLTVRIGIDDGITALDKSVVARASLAFLALLAVQYVAQRVSQYLVAWVGERFLRTLRSDLFRHLIRLDMGYYGRTKAGVINSRMTSDIESVTQLIDEGAVTLITSLLTVLGVAVAMVLLDWRLALGVGVVVVVLVAASAVFQRLAGLAYRDVREQVGRVLAGLQEGIAGVRVVQAFTQEDSQAGSFGRINEKYFDANMNAARQIAWYFPTVAFLRVAAVGATLLVGGRLVLDGSLSLGSLVAFLFYLDWFFQPIINLSQVYNLLQSAVAGLAKVFRVLDTPPTVAEKPDAVPLPVDGSGAVTIDVVRFGYDPAVPVLQDVRVRVAPGERLAVVGETGAGKSTAAKLVLRFYDPQEGAVCVDGIDLRDVTFASRAQRVALIPQEGFLFNGSLRDNLRYARPGASDDAIWEALRALGMEDWARALPERLDTEVRERGTRFSAGERQLVAMARALLADPAVIVLDEATANLDPETEVRVERALGVVLEGRTVVVIAHRLRSAEQADRVVMFDQGRVVAEGTHRELVAAGGGYARLVDVWRRGTVA